MGAERESIDRVRANAQVSPTLKNKVILLVREHEEIKGKPGIRARRKAKRELFDTLGVEIVADIRQQDISLWHVLKASKRDGNFTVWSMIKPLHGAQVRVGEAKKIIAAEKKSVLRPNL